MNANLYNKKHLFRYSDHFNNSNINVLLLSPIAGDMSQSNDVRHENPLALTSYKVENCNNKTADTKSSDITNMNKTSE